MQKLTFCVVLTHLACWHPDDRVRTCGPPVCHTATSCVEARSSVGPRAPEVPPQDSNKPSCGDLCQTSPTSKWYSRIARSPCGSADAGTSSSSFPPKACQHSPVTTADRHSLPGWQPQPPRKNLNLLACGSEAENIVLGDGHRGAPGTRPSF